MFLGCFGLFFKAFECNYMSLSFITSLAKDHDCVLLLEKEGFGLL